MIKSAITAAAIAALVSGNVAVAKDGAWRVGDDQIRIGYGDIDTNTVAGRAVLLSRVERAANRLCGDEIVRVLKRNCIRAAIESATAQVRNASLQLALAENNGLPLAAR